MLNNLITAQEFARQVGLSGSTIKSYEDRGLLAPAYVMPTGRRYYTQEQLERFIADCENRAKHK